jgi:uncharacterized membrane protein YukC
MVNQEEITNQKANRKYSVGLIIIGVVLVASALQGLIQFVEWLSIFTSDDWKSSANSSETDVKWRVYVYFRIGISACSLLLVGLTTYFFFAKKKRFPDMLITNVFGFLLFELLFYYISENYSKLTGQSFNYDPNRFTKILVFGVIAIMYLKKSARVKQVFIN